MTVNAHRVVGIAAPFVLALAALVVPAQAAAGSQQGGRNCQAIDSYAPNKDEEHTVAIADGRAYAGAWDKKAKNIVWQELSDNKGYPARACDITLSEQGEKVWIKAITTGGQVHETSCTSPGKKLICDKRWTRLR
ncbi:hypothetical protein DMA15_28410 [Streptomyces sp. WAC 01529]|uniref:hypothetical protein n=1 Tax=Streptomyces sp. WAC 01529 TaxID=2203205 RepID=UPI000F720216|nr:hypothetical protein [Streptomyces sp. WAC 01529]AZM56031.1 hypothetical protein DMA15_28410 [Streptomyces sp. WAC 01529]